MPVTATEPKRLSDLLKVTDNQLWDAGYMVDFVTVNESAEIDYEIGHLLGQVTVDGKYRQSLTGNADGSETIAVVCLENVTIPASTDTTVKVLVRGGAIVADKALILGDQTLADAKAALEGMNPPVLLADQL